MCSPGNGGIAQIAIRNDLVDRAELQRFGRRDRASVDDHLQTLRRADQTCQPGRATCARDDAQTDFGLTVGRGLPGDAQVARPRQFSATTPRLTIVRSDRDHGRVGDGLEDSLPRRRNTIPVRSESILTIDDELQRPMGNEALATMTTPAFAWT